MQDKTVKQSASLNLPESLASTEMIEEQISFHIKCVLEGVASCLSHFEKVDYQKVADVCAIDILAKCQSIIAKKYEDRIKELEKRLRQWQKMYVADVKPLQFEETTRADERQKIGEDLRKILLTHKGLAGIKATTDYVADKLLKSPSEE
jgi:hypothetical protein